jgi:hypothetical protein
MRSRRRMLGVTATMAVTLVAGSGVASASAPPPAQKQTFIMLNSKPTKVVPAVVGRFIQSGFGQQLGVDAAHVYRAPAPGGGALSVLPGKSGQVCVVFENEDGVSGCGSLQQVKAGALSGSLVAPDPRRGGLTSAGPEIHLGFVPTALAPALARSVTGQGVTAVIKSGFYKVSGKSPQLSSLLGRFSHHALSLQKRRAGVPAAPTATAAQAIVGTDCIPGAAAGEGLPGHTNCDRTFYYGVFAYQHNIRQITVSSWDGNKICGNAADAYGTWAGVDICSTNTYWSKAYNGSPRSPWAGPGYPSASGIGTAQSWWS